MIQYCTPDTSRYSLRKRKIVSYDAPKAFHFGRLPPEIRNMIYQLAVVTSRDAIFLDLTSWCPHWSNIRYKEPDPCGLRLVRLSNEAGNLRIAPDSAQNLNWALLMANKSIWREAAPMLYGQSFSFHSIEALIHFLSRLRPQILGCLRDIAWQNCNHRDRVHRLHDVVHYLIHAPMLQKLWLGLPPIIYGKKGCAQYDNVMHNRTVFLRDRFLFSVSTGRYFAFCLYRNYFGRWMVHVLREGGFQKLWGILRIRSFINVDMMELWDYMLTGDKWNFRNEAWHRAGQDMDMISRFWRAFNVELAGLLSLRLQTEDAQQANSVGRRTTRNSWKSIDLVTQLPDFDLRIP